jgi:hypothetical protein
MWSSKPLANVCQRYATKTILVRLRVKAKSEGSEAPNCTYIHAQFYDRCIEKSYF